VTGCVCAGEIQKVQLSSGSFSSVARAFGFSVSRLQLSFKTSVLSNRNPRAFEAVEPSPIL
jgi:hypothetical protein